MNQRSLLLAVVCAALWGCAVSPEVAAPSGAPGQLPAPAAAPASTQPLHSGLDALEERHRTLAQSFTNDGNWADALVQWELLALIQPQVQSYRDAVADTRARIARLTANLLPSAQLARKQGNLDQAEVLFLRVLKVEPRECCCRAGPTGN